MIEEYLVKAMDWLESGAMWIAGEIPVYVEELLKWEATRSLITFIGAGVILILLIIVIPLIVLKISLKMHRKCVAEGSYHDDGEWFLLNFISLVTILISLAFMGPGYRALMTFIQINVAPRVFLIEYMGEMLK